MKVFSMQLTKEQKDVLIGSLLGDGSLTKLRCGNSAFREGHSQKQYDYLKWKYDTLMPYSCSLKAENRRSIVKTNNGHITMSGNKTEVCWVMRTVSQKFLANMEQEWYQRDVSGDYVIRGNRRVKNVPDGIVLTPLVVAIWFMDDGSNLYNGKSKTRNAVFHTLSFSEEDCWRLRDGIVDLGLKDCGVRIGKKGPEVCVYSKSFFEFISMVHPFVPCESMRYKADINAYSSPIKSQAKLDDDSVRLIVELGKTMSLQEISNKVQMSLGSISNVLNGVSWSDVTGIKYCPDRSKGLSGIKGVTFDENSGKWMVRMSVGGKTKYLGIFKTKEEAIAVRRAAKFGEI